MFNSTKKLICITGPDGSGKTTVLNALLEKYKGYRECSIWDALEHPDSNLFASKLDVDNYLSSLTTDARVFFLAHALRYSIDLGMQADEDVLLLNGYYYKYFVSEAANGAESELLEYIKSTFPKPELVVYLDVPVEITTNRKKRFSRYECGGVEMPDASKFEEFQKRCAIEWTKEIQASWKVVDATSQVNEVVERVIEIIEEI